MKKIALTSALLLLTLVSTLLFRAIYTFDNQQPAPRIQLPAKAIFNQTDALQKLADAIKIPTISFDKTADKLRHFDAAAFLKFHQHLQNAFPLVDKIAKKTVINQYSLIFHLPGQNPALKPVLLLSHMDVVPVDQHTRAQWTHEPFSGDITDEAIWGRGTIDDKGGLIALMQATEILLEQGIKPQRSIYLAFGHDEEIGGNAGAAKIAEHFAANNVHFDFVLDEGGAITEGIVQGFDRPVALIGIAEKGYANLHLKVTASGGHSSQPPAQTAVGILSQAIVKTEQNPFPASLLFSELTFDAIGSYAPFGTRLAMANLWLLSPLVKSVLMNQSKLAASLHTITAATKVSGSPKANVLPTVANGVINVRIFPGETADSVKKRVEQIIDDPRVAIAVTDQVNPSPVSSTDSYGYSLITQTIIESDPNILVAPYLVQGSTDSKFFYPVADHVYRFLPIRTSKEKLKRFHGINEQIAVNDYFAAIQFYYRILIEVADTK